jgi:ferredoxin
MSKVIKIAVFSVTLAVAVSLSSLSSFGNIEIAKKEKTACTTCHVKVGSQELNAVGKCYAKKKSLKACEAETKEGKK